MPPIAFAKGHGLGNDYIVLSRGDLPFDLSEASIMRICDRNWGIGSDGILMLVPSTRADFGLRIFNPDGSEAEKSGNGLRIFSKWLRDHGRAKRDNFTIETPGGVVECLCHVRDGRVRFVTVEMGRATFRAPDIPMNGPDRDVVAVPLQLSDGTALGGGVEVPGGTRDDQAHRHRDPGRAHRRADAACGDGAGECRRRRGAPRNAAQ